MSIVLVAVVIGLLCLVVWFAKSKPAVRKGIVASFKAIGAFIGGIGVVIGGLFTCLVGLIVALIGLYVVVWLIKRMWEAA